MIRACRTDEDFQTIVANSAQRPVFLLKHSTRCPVSAGAHDRYQHFADELPEVECWEVLVVENRPLSLRIAADSGVTHQSPQAILFRNGQAVWHTSHHSIAVSGLLDALEKAR